MAEIEKLNDKCNKMKALIIKEKKMNVENSKLITDLKGKYESSQKENEQLSSQLQRLSMSIGELQSSQENDVSLVEQRYQEEIKRLKQEISEREIDYEETLKSTKEEMENVVDKLMRANERFEEESDYSNTLKKQKDELQCLLEDRDATIESLKVSKSELGKSLLGLEERMRGNSDELTSKLEESKRVIVDLESKLESSCSETEADSVLQSRMMNLEKENNDHVELIGTLRDEIVSLKEKIGELIQESSSFAEEGVTLSKEKLDIESSLDALREEFTSLQNNFGQMEREKDDVIANLRLSLEESNTAVSKQESLDDEIKQRDEEISTLKETVSNLQDSVAKNSELLELRQNEVEEYEARLKSSQHELETLHSKLETNHAEQLSSILEEREAAELTIRSELAKKIEEIESLKSQLEAREHYEHEIDELREVLSSKEKTIEELKCSSDDSASMIRNELDDIQEKYASACDERERLQSSIDTLKTEKEELFSKFENESMLKDREATLLKELKLSLNFPELDVGEDSDITDEHASVIQAVKRLIEENEVRKHKYDDNDDQTQRQSLVDASAEGYSDVKEDNEASAAFNALLSTLDATFRQWLIDGADLTIQSPEIEGLNCGEFEFDEYLKALHAKLLHCQETDTSNSVLKDGVQKVTEKCSKLEEVISNKDEELKSLRAQLHETSESLEELESDITTRDDQVEQLQTMVEDTRNIVRALEREKDALQSEIMELTSRSEEKENLLAEEVRELKSMVSSREESIHELQVSGDNLRDNEVDLMSRLTAAETRSRELTQEMSRVLEQSQCLESNLCETQNQLSDKEALILSHSTKVEELQKLVGGQSGEITELQNSVENLKNVLQERNSEILVHQRELEEQINVCDRLRADLHSKEEELENEKAHHEKERAQQFERDDLVETQSSRANELQTLIDSQNEELQELRNSVEQLKKALDEKNSEVGVQQRRLEEQANLCESLRADLHLKEEELEKEREELRNVQAEGSGFDERIQVVTNDLELTKQRESTLQAEIGDVRERLETALGTLRVKAEECEDLQRQLMETKESTTTLQAQVERLNESTSLVDDLHSQVASLREEKENMDNRCQELCGTVDSLEERLKAAVSESEHLHSEVNTVKEALTKETGARTRLQEELDDLQVSNKSLEKELNHQRKVTDDALVQSNSETSERLKQLNSERQVAVDKVSKMKHILVKLKRDLAEAVREKEESVNNISNVKAELSTLQESLTIAHDERKTLHESYSKERAQFEQALANMRETADAENSSMKAQIIVLEQEMGVLREQRQTFMTERLDAEEKLQNERTAWNEEREILRRDVDSRERQLKELKEGLQRAELQGRQRSVMDLELAEFERTVESLKDQLDAKEENLKAKNEELRNRELQIESLQGQVRELDNLRGQAEERGNKLKQMVMKTKRELTEVRKKEEELKFKSAGLSTEAEAITTQLEACKLELASASSDRQILEDRVVELRDRISKQQRSHESTTKSLKAQLDMVQDEKNLLTAEFDAYKAKAQAAFRRDRESGNAAGGRSRLSGSDETAVQAVRQRLEGVIERLKERLEEKENQLEASNNELELLQREHDRLNDKNKKTENDLRIKETQWSQRLSRISQENSVSESEHLSALHHLTQENEALLRNYKEQLRDCRSEHATEVQALRGQIEMGENENERLRELCLRLQQQHQQLQEQLQQFDLMMQREAMAGRHSTTGDVQHEGSTPLETMNGSGPNFSSTPRSIGQRMQAEGMEQPSEDGHRVDKVTHSRNSSYVTFEQLLSQPPGESVGMASAIDNSDAQSITSAATDATMESLRSEMSRSQKRCDHLSELLEDSESMVQHLTEQATVLKTEIRRHELNKTREKHVSNAEYIKNVVMKFLTLGTVQERRQLVPVLATVLSLTKEEKDILSQVAEVRTAASGDPAQTGQGWSSYFQWAGLT